MTSPAAPPVCPYCGTSAGTAGASLPTCPGCGAPLDVALRVSASGWLELPAARDMARIQCGHSSVQIEGKIVPVADFALAPGDSVYFPHHELLWKEPGVNITQRSLAGAWKRMLAGLPVRMLDAVGPGRIAFSRDAAGETLAIPLHAGASVDVREHLFMVATKSVAYDWFNCGVWFQTRQGDETETHFPIGMLMDRFTAPAEPGLLLIHAHGNGSQGIGASDILNGVRQNDAVDLLRAESCQRESQVDDHPAGRVECDGIRHIQQTPRKPRFALDETDNHLRRVVRIPVCLLYFDDDLRKGRQLHDPGSKALRHAGQEVDLRAALDRRVSRRHIFG